MGAPRGQHPTCCHPVSGAPGTHPKFRFGHWVGRLQLRACWVWAGPAPSSQQLSRWSLRVLPTGRLRTAEVCSLFWRLEGWGGGQAALSGPCRRIPFPPPPAAGGGRWSLELAPRPPLCVSVLISHKDTGLVTASYLDYICPGPLCHVREEVLGVRASASLWGGGHSSAMTGAAFIEHLLCTVPCVSLAFRVLQRYCHGFVTPRLCPPA